MSDEQGAEPADEADEADVDADEGAGEPPETGDAGGHEGTEAGDDPADGGTGTDEEPGDGISEGDFVELEYTVRTVEEGTLVDTTHLEVAEEEGIETEDREFGPRTIILGGEYLFDVVEEDIYGKEVGDSGSVTIPAAEAFGEYDPEEVRTVSAERIPEDSRQPGAHVNIDGQAGHVETIIGGRARVDFNHPLAGEEIEYEYEIVREVEDRVERAKGILDMYIDAGDLDMRIETEEEEETVYDDEGEEEGTETVEVETLYVDATPQLTMNQQWMFSKQQIAQDLIDRLGIDRVIVQEVLDGMGGMGGLGGMGGAGLEEMMEDVDLEDADLDDVDAEEIVEELEVEGGEGEGEADHDHDHDH